MRNLTGLTISHREEIFSTCVGCHLLGRFPPPGTLAVEAGTRHWQCVGETAQLRRVLRAKSHFIFWRYLDGK